MSVPSKGESDGKYLQPGAILFATIPFFATSSAMVLVMAETAPLDAV